MPLGGGMAVRGSVVATDAEGLIQLELAELERRLQALRSTP